MASSEVTADRAFVATPLVQRLQLRHERIWLLIDLLIVAWLCWLFDAINNLAPVRQALAVSDGASLLEFERSLHVDPEHTLNAWLASRHALSVIVVFWYENVHIAVTLAMFAWLWWRRPDVLGVMRATLVLVNLVALAIFWSAPVAPPRMVSASFVDVVPYVDHLPVWQLGATALHSNQLCSMPSLHIAWATWSSIAVWKITGKRSLRAVALVYPLLTTFAVIATGNHYFADALAGAALTGLVYVALTASARALRSNRRAVGGPLRLR